MNDNGHDMHIVRRALAAKREAEVELSTAFSFLVDDHNYLESPIVYGGGGYQQFAKTYSLGGRCIVFDGNYDRPDFYDLHFAPVDMNTRGELQPSLRYRSSWGWSIRRALKILQIEVQLPRWGRLGMVAMSFAEALQNHLMSLVRGDFNLFPATAFVVQLIGEEFNVRTTLGAFSTIDEAETCALGFVAQHTLSKWEYIEIVGREVPEHGRPRQ